MRLLVRVVSSLAIAATAAAQGVTVRGVVYDSLHSRPLIGAFVAVGSKTTTTDSSGRFAIADVAPGSYQITAQHDVIDRLGISAIGSRVRVTDGRDMVTVSLPSFRAMWRQVCGPNPAASDTGFVFGTVRSPRITGTDTVAASWIDVSAAGTKISEKQKTMEVTADSLGNFALCGVPTTTGLTIHATSDGLQSGSFDIGPMDHERIVRLDLTLSSPASATTTVVSGRVVADSGGGPLSKAELSITDLGRITTTDENGAFMFDSLPPGSHRFSARRIGYGEVVFSLDLRSAEHVEREIIMARITMLDSMAVTAKPLARDEDLRVFEEHRKLGLGKFLTQDDLDKANGRSLSQMMVVFPSLTIGLDRRTGKYKASFIGRGPKSIAPTSGCPMKVYVNGVLDRDYDLNEFSPGSVAGVEYYRGAAQTPPEYAGLGSGCGVIVIHLRNK